MENEFKSGVYQELQKLTLVVLSKGREKELNQVLNYWSKTPVYMVIIHDTQNPLNPHLLNANMVYINSSEKILDRLSLCLSFVNTPYAMIANDDEIFLIDPLIKFIDYLEHEKNIEAVGGQVISYNWAGDKLLGNRIYPFLNNYYNTDLLPINRIKNTFETKNLMDVTLMYRTENFKIIVKSCKNFSKFSTPVMYEVMFAIFSSFYCRSIRFPDVYWMRNWFTPFHQMEKWDRSLTWTAWCSNNIFDSEVTEWSKIFSSVLSKTKKLSNSQIDSLIKFLLHWKAIGADKQIPRISMIYANFKNWLKLILPGSVIWRVKKIIPFMRKKVMSDFDVLINGKNSDVQISSTDLENFRAFAQAQRLLIKS